MFARRIGFNEPNALAIIGNDGSGDNHIFHLYVREKDPKAELWDGARSGTQAAVDVFNADEVRWPKDQTNHRADTKNRQETLNASGIFCLVLFRERQRCTRTSPHLMAQDHP